MKTTLDEVKAYVEEITPRLEAGGLPVTDWAWVGSTYINGDGADIDIIVLTIGADIHSKSWSDFNLVCGGSEPQGSDDLWVSTKDAIGHNIIFITSPEYFDKWRIAAEVCKAVQRMCYEHGGPVEWELDKGRRVHIHNIIMDGVPA